MAAPAKVFTGYLPRPYQEALHLAVKRFNVIVCHRRFGKTHWAINEIIDRAVRNKLRNPQYAYIAPNYGQAKRVAWEPLKEYVKRIPSVTINEADLRVDFLRGHPFNDRVRIMLLGAENPGSIRGLYLDGVVPDEFAECDPVVWTQVLRPALTDRLGWASFIGTPKGQNHFQDVLNVAKRDPINWYWKIYKASETGIIPKEELDLARAEMTPEEYEQEFECSFTAALTGAYYGKLLDEAEKEKRISVVPYDRQALVDTYWDLGISDTTAIWFVQNVGKEFHFIDYHEMSGKGLDHYVKTIREKPYAFGRHVLPHDAAARELGTGRARVETLRDLGLTCEVQQRHKPEDGINACRMLFSRIWFDAIKCERGISCLKNYQQKYDTKNKIFSDTPLHNWASHAADAFRTFGMGTRDESRRPRAETFPDRCDNVYNIFGDN